MYYSCAIHKPSASRCQLLTLSILGAALLFETRGLLDDLSPAGARASATIEMSTIAPGRGSQPGLFRQGPRPSEVEPIEMEPDPTQVISDDRTLDSTTLTDAMPFQEARGMVFRARRSC